LWVAEEEIEELRIELMDLKDKMKGLNSEKMHLENALVQEKEQTNTLDSLVAPTLETARTSAIYQAELQAKQDTILKLELKIEEYEARLNDMMNDKNELGVKVDNLIKEKTELQLLMSKEKSELQSELQTRNYQLQSQLKDMEEKLAVMESRNCEGKNHDEEDSESANLRAQLEAMKKEMGSLKGT
jgi:chromosome segregation ATPase